MTTEVSESKLGVMRLFVWEGFCPDHTDGLAFAVAATVE